ncbi:MAG: PD-(D/E)XK nuclease family protein [Candidatus Omnitrophica bacterium]|nr:PD-(D/E)XK nuclease family protein [Candidatus Omnitrophota bacterium]
MIKLSRSRLELFLDCPRCFWLEMNKGVRRPQPAPYTINSAIDNLLKEEFDECRRSGKVHYLLKRYGFNVSLYNGEELNEWRDSFTGIRFEHKKTDFLVYGAVDDIWVNPEGELVVVDFKATGANEYKIYDNYRRQMEIYQWLLLANRYKVSSIGYFIFAKVNKRNGFSEGRLSFDLFIESCQGDSCWVEDALIAARETFDGEIPPYKQDCPYCQFIQGSR